MAYLEDASVVSFEILARELRAHGAPRALVLAAEKSARDEVRHARATAALARRHGAHVETVARRRAPRVRKLLDIAIENAAEGCVRETYGALLATHQAAHARDPKIRAVMTRIAKDETEHAALAWRIRAWAFGRLDARGRRAVDGAERQALAALHEELVAEPDSSVVRDAGVPTSARARMLLDALTAELRAA